MAKLPVIVELQFNITQLQYTYYCGNVDLRRYSECFLVFHTVGCLLNFEVVSEFTVFLSAVEKV